MTPNSHLKLSLTKTPLSLYDVDDTGGYNVDDDDEGQFGGWNELNITNLKEPSFLFDFLVQKKLGTT